MVFRLSATARGLGALIGLGGILLIVLGYQANPNNGSEVGTGELFVAVAVFMWILSFVAKESKRGGLFH